MKVLYPIHIDRWTNPIASLLREIAVRNPTMEFHSFSNPLTKEDRVLGEHFWSLPHVRRIRRTDLLRFRFDIVHVASATTANLVATVATRLRSGFKCLHVFTANIQPHTEDPYLRHYLLHLRLAHRVVAVSKAVAIDLERLGRRPDAVIPNGFDPTFFDPSAASTQTLEQYEVTPPYALFAAVLTRRKRPDVFIELARKLPALNFVMVGGYYRRAEADQYLQQIAGLKNLRYLGKVSRSELRDLMAFATALVFPSEIEGLPLTVVEAFGMGLPVLAQPKSSLPEVVEHGVNGWLLPADQLELWVGYLGELAAWSREKREAFRRAARRWAITRYSWDAVAKAYREFYRSMAEKARKEVS